MKQKVFFGVKGGENRLYVRMGDNNEVLITKTKDGELISEENTVHLNAEEAHLLGIQLLKLSTGTPNKLGEQVQATGIVESITVYQKINPDDTPSNYHYLVYLFCLFHRKRALQQVQQRQVLHETYYHERFDL